MTDDGAAESVTVRVHLAAGPETVLAQLTRGDRVRRWAVEPPWTLPVCTVETGGPNGLVSVRAVDGHTGVERELTGWVFPRRTYDDQLALMGITESDHMMGYQGLAPRDRVDASLRWSPADGPAADVRVHVDGAGRGGTDVSVTLRAPGPSGPLEEYVRAALERLDRQLRSA